MIYPPDRARAAERSGWATAIAAATRGGASGTLTAEAEGQEALFAYSPVRASTPFAVVFAWPWRTLTGNLEQQGVTLVGMLLPRDGHRRDRGDLALGLLSRPLQALAAGASRIARGEPVPAAERPRARGRGDSSLLGAFERMETSIQKRDQELRHAAALLEQRVRDRTAELVATQAALVDAERFAAMGKTSAAIAHEVKNALNGLGMAVDLIAQDPGTRPGSRGCARRSSAEIARLRDVVDSLLSFSRSPRIDRAPDGSRRASSPAPRSCSPIWWPIAASRSRCTRRPTLPRALDAHKIQGVLVNLVKNAIEAGKSVAVSLTASAGEAMVEVADDGPGLSAEARGHLFEPFFTTKPNGTGLGLPTSRRFIEAHGGTHRGGERRPRWAARCSGCGCRSTPRPCPGERGTEGRVHEAGLGRRSPSRGSGDPSRVNVDELVLVIDDEKTFRIVAEEALAGEGFVVTTAASGRAGLAAWQREPCDLVILDRHLPDTDGIAILEAMPEESRERGLDTLIVIATAYADVTSAVQALKLGAFDYLSKPLQLPDLVVTMRKALEAKRLRAQVRQLAGAGAGGDGRLRARRVGGDAEGDRHGRQGRGGRPTRPC